MKLSLVDKLKILSKLNTFLNDVQKGVQMKNTTKVISAVLVLVTGLLQIPDIQHTVVQVIASHPAITLSLAGLSNILTLLHTPNSNQ